MATDPAVVEGEIVESETAPQTVTLPTPTQAPEERVKAALARRDSIGFTTQAGIQLTSMSDALEWGRMVLDSGLAPRGFDKPSHIVVAAQTGRELGLGPAASLRAFYMTPQGKAALYAESALALCINSGLLVSHRHVFSGSGDDLSCTFYVLRKGDSEWRSESFSVREARVAGLVKPNSGWEKWPKRMVLARSRAFILHDAFADVLLGCPVEGDLDDLDPDQPKPPTPAPAPPPASRQPPPGGFTLLRDAMKPKESDAAGSGQQTGAAPAPVASEGSAPASGGVAAAGDPAEPDAPRPISTAGCDGNHAAPECASPGCWRKDPPPEKAAPAQPAAPKPSDACDHAPAIEHLKPKPVGRTCVCEKCTLTIKKFSQGYQVIDEPPAQRNLLEQ